MKTTRQNRPQVAGVTVLYNPDDKVYDNIRSYIDQIDKLFIIDNSDCENPPVTDNFVHMNKVVYVRNDRNLGIARALNIGAIMAREEMFPYLLTMDQDSKATPGMVDALLECFVKSELQPIGIVSPYHLIDFPFPQLNEKPFREVLTAWTSGNILNLSAYEKVGPFLDELFIDFVDHEYCLRLNTRGYKVMEVPDAILVHKIGNDIKRHVIFGVTLIVSNHNPTRRYYITRNRLTVTKMYKKRFPEFSRSDNRRFLAELFTIVMFEKDKLKKIAMIGKGIVHYLTYQLGSLEKPVCMKHELRALSGE